MSNIGHRARLSNGVRYYDVALASDYASLPDNFPNMLDAQTGATSLIDRFDTILMELSDIRRCLTGVQ